MSKFKQEVKLDDSIVILHNLLEMLYHHYTAILPRDIRVKFGDLIDLLDDEYYKDFVESVDIIDRQLVEKIVYDDRLKQVKPSDFKEMSFYDLLQLMSDGLIPKKVKLSLVNDSAVYEYDKEHKSYVLVDTDKMNTKNNQTPFDEYLKDSLTDMGVFEKNITIVETY